MTGLMRLRGHKANILFAEILIISRIRADGPMRELAPDVPHSIGAQSLV